MSKAARPTLGALALGALLAGLAAPVASLAFAEEPAPFCCGRGRCCCDDGASPGEDRDCLRRGCGCEPGDAAEAGVPRGDDAVLPGAGSPARPAPDATAGVLAGGTPLARPDAPPVPPPRRSPPA